MHLYLRFVYYVILTLAALVGLPNLKQGAPPHLRMLSILLIYTSIIEWSTEYSNVILHQSTTPVYNFFMLVEFIAYAYYFKQIISSALIRRGISWFMFLYPVFWYGMVFFVFKLAYWNSYIFLTGSTFTIIWALTYCYQTFSSEQIVRYRYSSEFWIAVGLLIFYTTSIPYMGMFNFLATHMSSLARLLKHLLLVSNILMYSLFTYAFICQMINTRKS